MMGRRKREQGKLFYEFRLEDRIPEHHLLRRMNVFVTAAIDDLHKEPEPYYSEIGRPSVHPELMIRMLLVDTAYGTGKFLGWLVKERRITPHIPVWDQSQREDGTFSRSDFKWDKRRGIYICPAGRELRTGGSITSNHAQLYRARKRDCDACSLKARCCPSEPSRKIPRYVNEDARDAARRKMTTKAFAKSRDERKRVEMRFGHLKTHHGFERLRLRGLSGARDEFHLAAIPEPEDAGAAPSEAAARTCNGVSGVERQWVWRR